MASFLDLESMADAVKPSMFISSFLFGCKLSSSARSYTFKVSDDDFDHILALNTVCLSEGATDECNVVEVVGYDYQKQEVTVPVVNLKLSCQPWLSLNDFQLQPPVIFRLRSGSGPVHLAGEHRIFHRRDLFDSEFSEESESFSETDESMDAEDDFIPIKPAKKQRKS